ncbi:uncharacterized protein LOC133635425 [Entelurus aequoreus]|uniref:uncharacterized protein LOC133635425 n=1 Tax=Entelurus aequoreus TaxID=161455 RepID=UPI002B1E7408|nr:uncharacterized protein LOC133635425 [Entelurus aequoreus]XP_061884601.1 uncharacterized protein LOC133635425 [Entelurus aequoreus]XP_061884602.1 uncharacterized protein LOC133635425 [Entelurus aequoreus]XP_061884603.1 uncharacterized protein LOC133635425 [Entelurus aequoreus]XP_061884604.1 uncharacterized protein LOC133635425 [Entelurus aequoreus]XP_061884606.1 uncharacterized protein LOC133635425 [Entelurus aequoreus]
MCARKKITQNIDNKIDLLRVVWSRWFHWSWCALSNCSRRGVSVGQRKKKKRKKKKKKKEQESAGCAQEKRSHRILIIKSIYYGLFGAGGFTGVGVLRQTVVDGVCQLVNEKKKKEKKKRTGVCWMCARKKITQNIDNKIDLLRVVWSRRFHWSWCASSNFSRRGVSVGQRKKKNKKGKKWKKIKNKKNKKDRSHCWMCARKKFTQNIDNKIDLLRVVWSRWFHWSWCASSNCTRRGVSVGQRKKKKKKKKRTGVCWMCARKKITQNIDNKIDLLRVVWSRWFHWSWCASSNCSRRGVSVGQRKKNK